LGLFFYSLQILLDPVHGPDSVQSLEGLVESRLAFEAGKLIALVFYDFYSSNPPSTQADFVVRNYFFRTAALHFWDFLVKNHPIVQFKAEFIQFLPTTQKSPFK